MSSNTVFIQPLGLDHLPDSNIETGSINNSTNMYIYETTPLKKADNLSIITIPSPYNEWIIGYNDNNSKSAFMCVGATTQPIEYKLPVFDHYFGIRFDDTGCFFNNGNSAYPGDLLNQTFSYSPENDSFEYQLVESFKKASSFKEKLSAFNTYLNDSKTFCEIPDNLLTLRQLVLSTKGNTTVYNMAEELGYSERHINRIFKEVYGFGPKDYCKYIRFQMVLAEILANPFRENNQFIVGSGFSDQAHFQREFKAFTGMTPKQFINTLK